MNKQKGLTLTALVLWGIVISLLALLGMKVTPEYIDYFKIEGIVKTISKGANGQTVADIRRAFDMRANVDHIQTIQGSDLDITKVGNNVVISFGYEKRIPLFYNISLLIDFQGSSSGRE